MAVEPRQRPTAGAQCARSADFGIRFGRTTAKNVLVESIRERFAPTTAFTHLRARRKSKARARRKSRRFSGLVPSTDEFCGYGAPGGSRTPGLQVRSLSLYPAELRARSPILLPAGSSPTSALRTNTFM